MKVLVTGGLGRLGQFVVRELLSRGHDVVTADIVEGNIDGAKSMMCDCTDFHSIRKAVEQMDAVIHLAAIPTPKQGASSSIFNINCLGTYYVYEACAQAGIRKISTASSINALGGIFGIKELPVKYFPIDEDHPQLCSDPYSFSKQVTEDIASFFWHKNNISSVSIRFSGIHMPDANNSARKHKNPDSPYVIKGYWTWVDARDAARILALGIEVPYEGAHVLHCNDSQNSVGLPSRELAKKYYSHVTEWRKDIKDSEALVSCDRAKALLGWEPIHH